MTKDELKAKYKELTGEDIDGTNDEIQAAIDAKTPAEDKTKKSTKAVSYVARSEFRDKITKKMYAKGDPIDKADEITTKNRLDRKLIEKA